MSEASPTPSRLEERLAPLLDLLRKQELVSAITLRQSAGRDDLVENLVQRQQQVELARALSSLHGADIAHLLQMLSTPKRLAVWHLLPPDIAADALVEVPEGIVETLVDHSDAARIDAILGHLDVDELLEIADELPPELIERAKAQLASNEQRWLEKGLDYPDDSVGELMIKDSLIMSAHQSVDEAIATMRSIEELPFQTDQIFVVNRFRHLVGAVPLVSLIRHEGAARLSEIMDREVVTFDPEDEAEDAGQAFERYDLISAPVLDPRRRIIGRLTVESVMDFLRERAESVALAKEGLHSDADLLGPVWSSAKHRWPWLSVNLVTAMIATRFISIFEGTIQELVALATLMPVVASVGGNTGNQTSALLIRGLALDQVRKDNLGFIYRKEMTIALINGLMWGSVLGALAAALYWNYRLGLVMLAAITLNLMLAAAIGITVPVVLERMDRDPAMGSSVMLTFATDSMGFFIFLGLASIFLV